MSKKLHKDVAKEVLNDLMNAEDGQYKVKMKTSFTGIAYNEKGGFYSIILAMDLTVAHPKGNLEMQKDIILPINLLADVNVPEPEAPPKAEKASKEEGPTA